MADADSPLNQGTPRVQNTVESLRNRYVSFEYSSFRKDVGQTTLPLLDAQPVETKPGAPLTGIGLFYKKSPGYGGFLALRIHTLNYGKYMDENIIEDILDEDPDVYAVGFTTTALDDNAIDDTAHIIYLQSNGTVDMIPSYSPYLTFLVVPLFFIFVSLYYYNLHRTITDSEAMFFNRVFNAEKA